MRKFILFVVIFFLVNLLGMFLFAGKFYYIPQFKTDFYFYSDQSQFQWIYNNTYYYNNNKLELDKEFLYSYSLLPLGYVRYKKVGNEIEFFLPNKQLFWKKPSTAYPYFEPYGQYILTINADRTQVEVMDLNGQVIHKINGIFLVDLDCMPQEKTHYCYFLFSDGKFVIIYQNNKLEFNPEIKKAFFKSFSIKNNQVAFHYYLDSNDYFDTYLIELNKEKPFLKKESSIKSKFFFPYTIPFLFDNNSIIFPHFKETLLIRNDKVYKIFFNEEQNFLKEVHQKSEINFDISYIGDITFYKELFFILKDQQLEIYDHNQNPLFFIPIKNSDLGSFFLYNDKLYIFFEDKGYIEFYFIL